MHLLLEFTTCKYNAWLGLNLVTKKKNFKLIDSSGGDMSTAVLQYLKQFDFIAGLGDTPVAYAKKRLEQKVKRFTLGLVLRKNASGMPIRSIRLIRKGLVMIYRN